MGRIPECLPETDIIIFKNLTTVYVHTIKSDLNLNAQMRNEIDLNEFEIVLNWCKYFLK